MKFVYASDQALLVRECDALPLFHALEADHRAGVLGFSPARGSLLIRFDPRLLTLAEVESWVLQVSAFDLPPLRSRLIEIPTLYIGEDLEELSKRHDLTTGEVVRIHSSVEYVAWFLGFIPGFAYLGDVPDLIATPRRASPRPIVPPGSIGIAGSQTGIYPLATPGGWNLIGRTEVNLFDWESGRSLIEPGDRVRFIPR